MILTTDEEMTSNILRINSVEFKITPPPPTHKTLVHRSRDYKKLMRSQMSRNVTKDSWMIFPNKKFKMWRNFIFPEAALTRAYHATQIGDI